VFHRTEGGGAVSSREFMRGREVKFGDDPQRRSDHLPEMPKNSKDSNHLLIQCMIKVI